MTRRQQRLQEAISLLATLLPYGELRMSTDPEYALTEIYHRVVRREKQLKRVIEAARAWMRTARDYEDCANQATEAYLGLPPGPEDV